MSLKLPRNWDFNLKMDAAKIGTVTVSLCPSASASAFQVQAGPAGEPVAKPSCDFGYCPDPNPLLASVGGADPQVMLSRELMVCK